MPGETVRKGPGNLYSQWALERTIGNLGEEIKQHSDPYSNLTQRGIRRAQVNALKAVIPELEPEVYVLPDGAKDIHDGYILLPKKDNCPRPIEDCEEAAIRAYIRDNYDDDISSSSSDGSDQPHFADRWKPKVLRWARVRLPNGMIARSSWKEDRMRVEPRIARVVKLKADAFGGDSEDSDEEAPIPEFAEVRFFMTLEIQKVKHYLAVASFYGPPDPHLFKISSKRYWSVQHQRDEDVRAFKIKDIDSCVTMAPDEQYRHLRDDESAEDRWFLMQKPGLKLAQWAGFEENMDEDND
ncbi:hypothetical protein C8R43DRAFT_1136650 [Mycena crocata]|nr:hypothetical protein C8R43DRAFT_1136650 [Mycena crocata]